MGKGDKNRVSDLKAYWTSPLWDNMKNKKCDTDLEKDVKSFIPEYVEPEKYKPMRYLLLDDIREPNQCYLHDESNSLIAASRIPSGSWDVVRSYDEFVAYVEKFGIPHVVSFDNDLIDCQDTDIPEEELGRMYAMIDWENSPVKTGAHCAAWLCERCKSLQHPLPSYYIHTANSIARPIIKGIMNAASIVH